MRSLALLALAWLVSTGSSAAIKENQLPGPGLYRIDSAGGLEFVGSQVQTQSAVDGASGDTTTVTKARGQVATRQTKGDAPVTHCVKAITGGAPLPPQAQACTGQSTVKIKDGWLHTAQCPSSQLQLTIHQLDKDRWEYISKVTMLSTGSAPAMGAVEKALRHQVQHGATAAERSKAEQQLAQVPAMQKEGNAQYAEVIARMQADMEKTSDPQEKAALQAALASMAPGQPAMVGNSRQLWTRIGNVCN